MSEHRSLVAPLIVLAQLAVCLTPCPGALLPATNSPGVRQEPPRSHPIQATGNPELRHHTHAAAGSEMDSGQAHHPSASALERRGEVTVAVLGIPCPCGCSRRSETGRVPLSVGDFVPPDVSTLEAFWSRTILLGSFVEPPVDPVFRVFHVPISV